VLGHSVVSLVQQDSQLDLLFGLWGMAVRLLLWALPGMRVCSSVGASPFRADPIRPRTSVAHTKAKPLASSSPFPSRQLKAHFNILTETQIFWGLIFLFKKQ